MIYSGSQCKCALLHDFKKLSSVFCLRVTKPSVVSMVTALFLWRHSKAIIYYRCCLTCLFLAEPELKIIKIIITLFVYRPNFFGIPISGIGTALTRKLWLGFLRPSACLMSTVFGTAVVGNIPLTAHGHKFSPIRSQNTKYSFLICLGLFSVVPTYIKYTLIISIMIIKFVAITYITLSTLML